MATEFSRGAQMTVGMFKELANSRNWPDDAVIHIRYPDFEIENGLPATCTDVIVDWSASTYQGKTHAVTLMSMTYEELINAESAT